MLRRPNGYVLRALAEVPMVPAREVGAAVPAGTGPYTVARWDRGALLRLERRDDYWGPPPAIAAVEFAIVPDAAQALTLARRGEIDVVPALIPEHWPEQATAPGVVVAFAPMTLAPPRFVAVILDARRPPFDDRRVRRAAAMLFERGRLAREGWRGPAPRRRSGLAGRPRRRRGAASTTLRSGARHGPPRRGRLEGRQGRRARARHRQAAHHLPRRRRAR